MKSEVREFIRRLREKDPALKVEVTGGGHYRVRWPDGVTTILSASPSDHRTWLNKRSELRKMGKI